MTVREGEVDVDIDIDVDVDVDVDYAYASLSLLCMRYAGTKKIVTICSRPHKFNIMSLR
jgi:hypothetical protein